MLRPLQLKILFNDKDKFVEKGASSEFGGCDVSKMLHVAIRFGTVVYNIIFHPSFFVNDFLK